MYTIPPNGLRYPCCQEPLDEDFSDIRSVAAPDVNGKEIRTHTICPQCGTRVDIVLTRTPTDSVRIELGALPEE